jgi:mono/diheme cytochrome c family protein
MPSEDFQLMSDRELSDIVAYLRSMPAVDREMAPPSLGPLGTILMATGELRLSADTIRDHQSAHAESPPEPAPTAEFGRHLAGICTGCHRPNFEGGPIAAGPPDWVPAANLTPHADGLAGWSYDDFLVALRDAKRPDGTDLREPMALVRPYAQRMTDVEIQAMWAYLQSISPVPDGH